MSREVHSSSPEGAAFQDGGGGGSGGGERAAGLRYPDITQSEDPRHVSASPGSEFYERDSVDASSARVDSNTFAGDPNFRQLPSDEKGPPTSTPDPGDAPLTSGLQPAPRYSDLLQALRTVDREEEEVCDPTGPQGPHDIPRELPTGDRHILLRESPDPEEERSSRQGSQQRAAGPPDRSGDVGRPQHQSAAENRPRPAVRFSASTPCLAPNCGSDLSEVDPRGPPSSSPASSDASAPGRSGGSCEGAAPAPVGSGEEEDGGCCCIPLRFLIVLSLFLGMVVVNAMRTNIGVTVLTILDKETHRVNNDTGQNREIPTVDWNTEKIGYLHSIFYVGYLITHLPGGYLTTRLPSHKMFGGCILVSSVLNLTLPVAIELAGYSVTLLLRFLQGLSEGLLYPSCYGILRHWSTPQERGRVGSLVLTGAYFGPAVGFPLAGIITDYFGWDYIYYVNGGLGVIFVLFWTWVSEEKPAHHSKITAGELSFIEELQGSETHDYEGLRIPWRAIMTSPAVLSLCLCNIARNWVFILGLTNEPFYLNMFKFTIAQNGAFSALPHIFKMSASLISGLIADFILSKHLLTTTHLRKVLTAGFGVQSFMFLMLTLTTNSTVAMVLLISAFGFGGFVVSGWQLNHYDLSVRHASVLVAVSSTFGNVASISVPIVTGYLTVDKTFRGWNEVFYITSAVTGLACLSFLLFGSGERQSWAQPSDTSCLVVKEDKRRRRPYSPAPTSAAALRPSGSAALSPPAFAYSTLREASDDNDRVTRSPVPDYGSRETTPAAVHHGGSDVRTGKVDTLVPPPLPR